MEKLQWPKLAGDKLMQVMAEKKLKNLSAVFNTKIIIKYFILQWPWKNWLEKINRKGYEKYGKRRNLMPGIYLRI